MAIVISLANNKGGVGKSSLTMNLGGVLAEMGHTVLLVDLDAQSNLSSVFIGNSQERLLTVNDLIFNDISAEDVIRKTKVENISLIPASVNLRDLDARLAGEDDAQFFLDEELVNIKNRFDFVLIDCPPSLGKATRIAMVASNYVIVPIECQEWAVKGCRDIIAYIDRVKRRANPKLELMGIVINRLNTRRHVESIYRKVLRETFGDRLFETEFRDNVPYVEAVTSGLPINLYKPQSPQTEAYRSFAREVISHVKEKS